MFNHALAMSAARPHETLPLRVAAAKNSDTDWSVRQLASPTDCSMI
jgi:hypothetical protein